MMISHQSSWLVLVAMSVLLLAPPALTQADFPRPPTSAEVRGEVVMLTSELVVVALVDGTRSLFHLGKDATVDSSVKVTDRVELRVTPDNHVISVKKLAVELLP
jgi:hypothetical protein